MVTDTSPSTSSQRVRPRSHRVLATVAVLLLATVIGVVLCERAGWPFLVKPVEGFLSKTLRREFRLQDDPSAIAAASLPADAASAASAVANTASGATRTADAAPGEVPRAAIHFFGGLRVQAPRVFIASPSWSQDPFFLDARDASLRMGYGAIWRASRGGPLDLKELKAKQLAVNAERRADGSSSWEFGDPAKAKANPQSEPMSLPIVRELVVEDGFIRYVDAPLQAKVTSRVRTREGSDVKRITDAKTLQKVDTRGDGLHAEATGTYRGMPLRADLHAPGVLAFVAGEAEAPPIPVVFEIRAGRTQLGFVGTVRDVMRFAGLTGVFNASGRSLAEVGEPLGVTLPSTGAFRLKGRLAKQGEVWNVVTDEAVVGDSRLAMALTYDAGQAVPLLSGKVGASTFFLKDLLPTVGVPPAAVAASTPKGEGKEIAQTKGGKLIPQQEFDLPSLRVMNANVLFAFDRAELGNAFDLPLQPLNAHLTLRDSRLTISDIDARTAEGSVRGMVSLDAAGPTALWRTRLRWDGVRLERWLKQERKGDAPAYIAGRIAGRAELQGKGNSTAKFLSSLDGSVMTTLRNGQLSHLIVEAAGLDIAQALGVLIKGDRQLPMNCAVVDLAAKQGVLTTRTFVVDTRDSMLLIDGELSLAKETMDLRAVVSPKDFSPVALRSPIYVNGSFADPKVSIEKGPIIGRVGAAVALAFVNPFAAILPLLDPGSSDDPPVGCAALTSRAREAASAAGRRGDMR